MNNTIKTNQLFQEGCIVCFENTISEHDILRYAEISGDFSPNHVNEEFMKNSIYGKRIAHGALLVAYMSKASSLILEEYPHEDLYSTAVSLGYHQIRFIKPVFIDDTVTITYTVDEYNHQSMRAHSKIEIVNQHNELVAVATHILKWVANSK